MTRLKRKLTDCIYYKPRGKKTHYCTIDIKDPLKRCYGVCKMYIDIKDVVLFCDKCGCNKNVCECGGKESGYKIN